MTFFIVLRFNWLIPGVFCVVVGFRTSSLIDGMSCVSTSLSVCWIVKKMKQLNLKYVEKTPILAWRNCWKKLAPGWSSFAFYRWTLFGNLSDVCDWNQMGCFQKQQYTRLCCERRIFSFLWGGVRGINISVTWSELKGNFCKDEFEENDPDRRTVIVLNTCLIPFLNVYERFQESWLHQDI